ncbi:MAG: hypothetical protein QNJ33_06140 [Crocosphaera sp.]|nr:hypothetical protein [Crocosphaera sp.]
MVSDLKATGNFLLNFWFEPIDVIKFDTFRRFFALTFLVYMAAWFRHPYEWLTSEGFHFTAETKQWFHINPFPLLPHWAVPLFALLVFCPTFVVIFSKRYRLAAVILLAVAIYIQNVDNVSSFTLNKFYIVFFALIAVSPQPQLISLPDGSNGVLRQSAWPVRVIQATTLIQYFTAGTCKVLHGNWLQYSDVLWTQVQGLYCTEIAAWLLRILPLEAWSIMMYGALIFELVFPLLFMVKRLRIFGWISTIGFLIIITLTMYQLFYFTFQLLSFLVVFADERFLYSLRKYYARLISQFQS